VATRLDLPTLGHILGYVLAAVFAGVCVWLLRRVWRGRIDWIDAAGWATLAMLVAASSLLPWYVAWALPLAAVARDRRLVRATLAMTGVVLLVQMLGYIPHGGSPLG
jgi:biotin transporter BioY